VAFAIVCEDGVAGAGDHIGLPIKDGVSDERRSGPSVCDGHIVKRLVSVDSDLARRSVYYYTPEAK
jgi:hypothetical protein